ncbi:MAG: fibrillin [Leptolyngbya sp. SIO4C5]|uniref:PAP/fibrillin family protein n=1 Tax=Sphaerothrix gracilis TaxID=3151835 RepID=UPI0013C1ACF5|nr:fibrillin [Leptolyngbya sp. SIO4C5]
MLAKAELKQAIANKNRGLAASPTEKTAILAAIARLEDRNPTPQPLEAPELLEGDWRLRYTSSQDLLGIDRLPLLTLGQIYQCIRTAESKVYNIAEVTGLPLLEGLVSVAAQFEATSPQRVNVKFERGVLALQRLIDYRAPSQLIHKLQNTPKLSLLQAIDFDINSDRQQGWLEVTYLDQDMRLGRGNEGSVFVLTKD